MRSSVGEVQLVALQLLPPPCRRGASLVRGGDSSFSLVGGWTSSFSLGVSRGGGPGMETQGCVCVYGQRDPESLHWPGSSHVYYGVRRMVVGVQVVEEVAVEDTIEVITEDVYTEDPLDPELLLLHAPLYPT
ncbi:hypothetical protein CesoFtcFv8_012161 [Champsocephalus esox]|uniref:Uncharacterized protein n=1 Tax=Champsocephalus esox TaxID=159716 RepID=A0AAN8GUD0_9TELE|nr:hypothetical protein CesoFtcFv8_012161 [Champsocephalus esox]